MILIILPTFTRNFLLLLTAGLLLLPFSTAAFFSNTESSPQQRFGAATLALEPMLPTPAALTVTDDSDGTTNVAIHTTAESIAAHYDVTATELTGDTTFCNALEVTATSTEGVSTAQLAGYASGEVTTFGAWQLAVRDTSSDTTVGAVCQVTIAVTAWQENMSKGAGYGDTTETVLTITRGAEVPEVTPPDTGTVALNEIFPAYENQADEPLEREWVELYNGTNDPVDVAGWSLSEISGSAEKMYTITNVATNNGSEVAPYNSTNTEIAPGGFLVLEYVGNRLNNTGDTVRVYDAGGILVDEFAYPDTDNGDAQARVPDGVGDWVVQAPTPNATNEPSASAFRFSSAVVQEASLDDEQNDSPAEPLVPADAIPEPEESVVATNGDVDKKDDISGDEVERSELDETVDDEESSTDDDTAASDEQSSPEVIEADPPVAKPENDVISTDASTGNDITN